MLKALRSIYVETRLIQVLILAIGLFIIAFIVPETLFIAQGFMVLGLVTVALDLILLFNVRKGVIATRFAPDKLSNGDDNPIKIFIENNYGFKTNIQIIDEAPNQFQLRNTHFDLILNGKDSESIDYMLRPTKRGSYEFGIVNTYAKSPIGFLSRRFKCGTPKVIPVYPSYIQMRQYELLAISNKLTEYGIKKIRRIGQNMEFEQIKNYVQGDDIRAINWKATARNQELMVNNYQDE